MEKVIVYKDADIIVCAKPSGMLSQSDDKGEKGLKELLEEHLSCPVYLIHRLDRPVSGLIVFALSSKAAAKLSADISDHVKFVKEYLAIVSGRPAEDAAILKDMLYFDRKTGKAQTVSDKRNGAKPAELEYTHLDTVNLENSAEISLLRVRLHTGRTHQIRAQLSSRGYPIAGDGKYGSKLKTEGIALHSFRISFTHPVTGKKLDFTNLPNGAAIFDNFKDALSSL